MQLPNILGTLLKTRRDPPRETFLSLTFDVDSVQAAVWSLDKDKNPNIVSSALALVADTTWESRLAAAQGAIQTLEKDTGATCTQVVFGFSQWYLTPSGDIEKTVRGEIHKLTKKLSLKPLGFVPVDEAIMYFLKKEEGVPANAILLGISGDQCLLSLYKVGIAAGRTRMEHVDHLVKQVEDALKHFIDVEVLPSRILLYGGNKAKLEEAKRELLRHPWQTHANFLHFPKIDCVASDTLIAALCVAGASELAGVMVDEAEEEREETIEATALPPKPETDMSQEKPGETIEVVADATPPQDREEEKETEEEGAVEDVGADNDVENVVMVEPEALGFHTYDELAHHGHHHEEEMEEVAEEHEEHVGTPAPSSQHEERPSQEGKHMPIALPIALPALRTTFARFSRIPRMLRHIPIGGAVGIALIAFVLLILGVTVFWILPHATVTVFQIPQTVTAKAALTVDPTATVADPTSMTVPGVKQEKSVSGEKTMPVTGKKQIGDPAKGNVTIYNKSLSSRTFKKGSVLTSGSLKFVLDDEVKVASASESIGSITFGKADAGITAFAIGTPSNLSGGTEFVFQDTSDSIAIARNTAALTGGTSKDVTVVTRADYDALVKAVSEELVIKAKEDLVGSVSGGAKLIDDTIKTTVTDKQFTEELDQEAQNLHGKVTVTISGLAYTESDVRSILESAGKATAPSGYTLVPEKTEVSVNNVQVKKDGKVTGTGELTAIALPTLDTATIKKNIVGKPESTVTEYLKTIPGVGGVQFGIQWSLWKNSLPMNAGNISLKIEELQ